MRKSAIEQLEEVINHNYENNKHISFALVFNLIEQFKEAETDNLRHAYNHSCIEKSFEDYKKEYYEEKP